MDQKIQTIHGKSFIVSSENRSKVCTSFPRQFLVIKASEFAPLVNIKAIWLALLSISAIGTFSFPAELSLTTSPFYKNVTDVAFNNQPT